MPFRKGFSNNACPIYPLSAHSFLLMFSMNLPCFKGSWSSIFSGVKNFVLVIDYQMQLESDEPFHGIFFMFGKSFKSLVNQVFSLRKTCKGVESMKLMQV